MYSGIAQESLTSNAYMDNKGIKVVRRSESKLTKDILVKTLETLHYEKNTIKAIQDIKDYTLEILDGKMEMEKFIITKKLGKEYKSNTIAHAYLAKRVNEREGLEVYTPGDRVKYAFYKNPLFKKTTQQFQRVEDPKFIVENKMALDYRYYIEKQIKNSAVDVTKFITSDLGIFFDDISAGGNGKQKQLLLSDFFSKKR